MGSYIGYEPNSREEKETTNRRNGYFDKTIKTSMGETAIEVPRDRQASFESIILPKHKRDVSAIENKVLAMYARGMSQRDIPSFSSTASSCPLSAITRRKNVLFKIFWAFVSNERKEILGLWIQDSESKHAWMQIFDELKS